MSKRYLAVVGASAFFYLSGCASMASFQGADTVAKGSSTKGVGMTYNQYTMTLNEETDDTVDVGVPAVHGWWRYGVTDQLEVHTMAWVPLGATAGAKYQLLGAHDQKSGLSLSAGLDVGYLSISSEDDDESSSTIIDTHVPIYAGYRLSPGLTTYAVPRYVLRMVSGAETTATSHLVGGAVGLGLGKSTVVHLEGVVMYDLTYGETALTGGLGLSF